MKKLLALVLAVLMVVSLFAACKKDEPTTGTTGANGTTTTGNNNTTGTGGDNTTQSTGPAFEIKEGEFTYKTYTTSLATCWNPHTWETNSDSGVLSYLETPLVSMSVDDSENGVYQWIYLAATEVNDVTKDHQSDLTKYGVTLPKGQTAAETEKGFVFEIKLNPNMKWQDGTAINADTYIYSMQMLLNPDMMNYRANLFYSGESAVAGGFEYYYANTEGLYLGYTTKYATLAEAVAAETVYINCWNFWGANGYIDAEGNECPQYVAVTDETVYSADGAGSDAFSGKALYEGYYPYLEVGGGYEAHATIYQVNENMGVDYDVVGCYKVDDYTIIYVTESQIDYYYFMTSLTSNWLVHKETYEAGFDTTGALTTTDYNTAPENTMSYGPYKMTVMQDGKQMVFERNEYWYDYEKTESGYIYSITDYLVDGEYRQQYQTTKIVIDVMKDDAAKLEFMKGNLSVWGPTADDLPDYSMSDQLYKADETYTMSFFFNTGLENLKTMDESKGNTNSVVLSNVKFRKAFSLSIDRSEWVGATAGYKPTFGLLNTLYFYDVYNDPNSSYRNSDAAMQAICNLYGVEYGEGKAYKTLQEAYRSINGYNLTEAKKLMKEACEELVAAGLYTAGAPIHIRIAYAAGAMSSAANQQVELMNKYINAAAEGSGFGAITLEGVGNVSNRYAQVPAGEFAIGYGAWGGAAFYPFRNFQVYCDPDQYDINEAGCWDPTTEMFTINVGGEDITKSWQDWSGCMVGSGDLADLPNEQKLVILATLEEAYLNFVYRIPLASSTSCTMLSYQISYYTEDYNIMYGFGGFDLLIYNFNDAEWAEVVAEEGGELDYT